MLYYVQKIKADGSETTYISEDRKAVDKLGGGRVQTAVGNISMKDVAAYFKNREPNVRFVKHKVYNALECLDPEPVWTFVGRALEISQLGQYSLERVKWEEERKKDIDTLEGRVKND